MQVDKIPSRRSRNSHDPVKRLPPELLLWVIRDLHSFPRDPTSQLLDLASISRDWQQFVISAPILWNLLYIEGSKDDLLAIIALQVRLSGTVPLHIFVGDGIGPQWGGISELLVPLRHQVVSLTILGDTPAIGVIHASSSFLRVAATVFRRLGYLHNLKEIRFERTVVWDTSNPPPLYFPPTMLITSDVDLVFSEESASGTDFTRFSKVILRGHITTLAHILRLLPLVKTLILTGTSEATIDQYLTPFTTGLLPQLEHLIFSQDYCASLKQLIQITASHLTFLSLRLPATKLMELFELLIGIRNLEELVFDIILSGDALVLGPVPVTPVVHSLSSLKLEGTELQSQEDLGATILRMTELFPYFFNLYPSVERLTTAGISFSIANLSQLFHLEAFARLQFLSIQNWEKAHSCLPIQMDSVMELEVDDPGLLKSLHVPNLLSLRVTGLISINELDNLKAPYLRKLSITTHGYLSLTCDPDSTFFPELCSLSVETKLLIGIQLPSFSQLAKITLHERSHPQYFQGNTFCMLIIYDPYQLPVLDQLDFNKFVEWDILFHMLERRNLEPLGVKRIGQTSFPFVPLMFRSPLKRLLGGQGTGRPSDEALSMEATRELIFDLTMLRGLPQEYVARVHKGAAK